MGQQLRDRSRRTRYAVLVLLTVLLLVAVSLVVLGRPQVTELEAVTPPTFIREITLFDSWQIRLGSESRRLYDGDSIPSALILLAAGCGLALGVVLGRCGASYRRRSRVYVLGSLGLALLACDELFGLHETVGYQMEFLTALGVKKADDVVFAVYPVAIAVFVWVFRDVLLGHRTQQVAFALAGLLIAVAALSDIRVHLPERIEDAVELLGALAGLYGLGDLVRRDLRAVATRLAALPPEQ